MNALTKILVVLIILACAGFFVKGPGGKPFLSMDSLTWWSEQAEEKAPILKSVTRTLKEKLPGNLADRFDKSDKEPTVYKWKDENGVWHYSDAGNPEGEAEIMEFGPENDLIYLDPPKFEETETTVAVKPQKIPAPRGAYANASGTRDSGDIGPDAELSEVQKKNPVRQALIIRNKVQSSYDQLEEVAHER